MPDRLRQGIVTVRHRCVHPPLVTITAITAVLATAARYRVFTRELPLDVAFRYGYSGRALSMGRWSTLLTSQFLTRNAFMAVSIALSLALMLGLYEAIAGTKRALVVATVSAVAGPLLVAGVLGVGSSLGYSFASRTLSTLDYGASAVTAGAGGALVAVLGMRRLRWFAIVWVVGGVLLHHQIADWEHVGSFAVGFGLGRLLGVAPPIGIMRRQLGWIGSRVGRPSALVAPVLALGLIVGSLAGGAAVPARHAPGVVSGGRLGAASAEPASVISVQYPTPSVGGTRNALVILPAGYAAAKLRYPVVEMLHGSPGSPNDIITGFDPITAGAQPGVPAFIGVAPDGHGPVVSEGAFADTSKQRLGAAVSDDLRRFVDRRYRTNGRWAVSGLSSGGYGAAYLGSRTPGQYDAVCSMSGNFTPKGRAFQGEPQRVLSTSSPLLRTRPDGPRTLLVTGSSDGAGVRNSLAYAQALRAAGQAYESVVVPGGHDWKLWNREFPRCLRFMLAASPTSRPRSAPPTALTVAAPKP